MRHKHLPWFLFVIAMLVISFVFLLKQDIESSGKAPRLLPKNTAVTEKSLKLTPSKNDAVSGFQYQAVLPNFLTPQQAFLCGVRYSETASTEKELDRAIDYIQYSAATGYAEAQFKLGLMYFQGIGVSPNTILGFYWIKKAALNDYSQAQIYLSYMYRSGIGTNIDMFQSQYWLCKAHNKVRAAQKSSAKTPVIATVNLIAK